jgi:uncharacterized membrane protein YtjA (UPF0391 family)
MRELPPNGHSLASLNSVDLGELHRSLQVDGSIASRVGSVQMLQLIVTLLIIALIAAVFGFGGIAGAAVGIAKIVFFVALVLFLISLVAGGMRGFGRRL